MRSKLRRFKNGIVSTFSNLFRRKKTYMFADEMLSSDALISFISGIIGSVLLVISFIMTVKTKGNPGNAAGCMLAASFVLSVTGFIFGQFSKKQVEGSVNSKRVAIGISLVNIILLLFIMFI